MSKENLQIFWSTGRTEICRLPHIVSYPVLLGEYGIKLNIDNYDLDLYNIVYSSVFLFLFFIILSVYCSILVYYILL